MAFEHRPGSFSLFKNDQKGNEKAPNYKGNGMDMDGNMVSVSAWLKEGSSGKFLSCKMEPMRPKQDDAPKPAARPQKPTPDDPFADMDDSPPF